jgi:hypothetical protein
MRNASSCRKRGPDIGQTSIISAFPSICTRADKARSPPLGSGPTRPRPSRECGAIIKPWVRTPGTAASCFTSKISFCTFARSPLSVSISGVRISVSFPPIAWSAARWRHGSATAADLGVRPFARHAIWQQRLRSSLERRAAKNRPGPKTAHWFFGLGIGVAGMQARAARASIKNIGFFFQTVGDIPFRKTRSHN